MLNFFSHVGRAKKERQTAFDEWFYIKSIKRGYCEKYNYKGNLLKITNYNQEMDAPRAKRRSYPDSNRGWADQNRQ